VLKLGANSVPGQVVLDTSGNVGIGTDSPAGFLHLYDTDYNRFIIERNNGTSNIATATFNTFGATTTNIEPRLAISVGSSESTTTGTLFVAAGKLGINKSAPTEALDVVGNANISGELTATTLNGAFGNTAVKIASSYGVTPSTGNMWFDSLNLKLKVYDGSNWQDAVPSSTGGGANTGLTDANATFRKYTYTLSSATSVISGVDDFSQTLSYVIDDSQNVEVFVNGVKQVEGASNDYTATTGTAVSFTTTLSSGDIVDIQVYELLTNDAFYLKTETYTQTETNEQITTALGDYVPAAGGTFTGNIGINNSNPLQKLSVNGVINSDYNSDYYGAWMAGNTTSGQRSYMAVGEWYSAGLYIQKKTGEGRTHIYNYNAGHPLVIAGGSGDAGDNSGGSDVGIGEMSPRYKLDVSDTTANNFLASFGQSLGTNDWTGVHIGYKESNNVLYRKTGIAFQRDADSAARGKLHFLNNGGADSTSATISDSKMVIDWTGDVTISGHLSIGTSGSIPSDGGIARLSNGYTYFTGKSTDNGAVLSNGDGTATVRAMNPGSSAGYLNFETGNGAHVISIDTSGNFLPQTTSQDLGSIANPWQNIYTQDLVLSNEARAEGNEVDGTKGNWTIQEGEDHLYIINNKNGKKYRFALEEIE
jgi:hypothetical protein